MKQWPSRNTIWYTYPMSDEQQNTSNAAAPTQRDFPFELLGEGSIINFANGREARVTSKQSSPDGKVIFALHYKDDPAEQYMTLDDIIAKADAIVSVTEAEEGDATAASAPVMPPSVTPSTEVPREEPPQPLSPPLPPPAA